MSKSVEWIFEELNNLDRTATWLANKINISPAAISKWKNGTAPSSAIIIDIIIVFAREEKIDSAAMAKKYIDFVF
jgi:hypothetical protein